MKNLNISILEMIYLDYTLMCNLGVSKVQESTISSKDFKILNKRYEHEGESFLAITLPSFCADFFQCIELGYVSRNLFSGWKKDSSGLPRLFSGFLRLVFSVDGTVLDEPNVYAIDAIRQLCLAFQKMKMLTSDERLKNAESSFIHTDQTLDHMYRVSPYFRKFRQISRFIWSRLARDYRNDNLVPKHGPGAVADTRIRGTRKFQFDEWSSKLEERFPMVDNAYLNAEQFWDALKEERTPTLVNPMCRPARMVFVPKTRKSPRVITIEPQYNQFIQQCIKDYIYEAVNNDEVTSLSIDFNSQSNNQDLAVISSKDKSWTTFDLSEASDRVSLSQVEDMMSGCPDLWKDILACRSDFVKTFPTGKIVYLKKFASMGSALCFPIETVIFYCLAVAAIIEDSDDNLPHFIRLKDGSLEKLSDGMPLSIKTLKSVSKSVRIFGDDIIVKTKYADSVRRAYESFGWKINSNKSFKNSHFRESCGTDAYEGNDITPVYIRKMYTDETLPIAERFISCIETINLFYKKGLWQVSNYLKRLLLKGILIPDLPFQYRIVPITRQDGEGIGYFSYLGYQNGKWNKDYQCFSSPGYKPYKRNIYSKGSEYKLFEVLTDLELRKSETASYTPRKHTDRRAILRLIK